MRFRSCSLLLVVISLMVEAQDDEHWFWYEPYYNSIFRQFPWLQRVFGFPFGYNWWCAPFMGKAGGGCPQWYGYPNYPNVYKFGFGRAKFCSFCLAWAAVKLKGIEAYKKCSKLCDKRKKQTNQMSVTKVE